MVPCTGIKKLRTVKPDAGARTPISHEDDDQNPGAGTGKRKGGGGGE